jgi:hypothetical protein
MHLQASLTLADGGSMSGFWWLMMSDMYLSVMAPSCLADRA